MQKIKFEAEIDLSATPVQVSITAIKDPWTDFGYLLEIMALMSKIVMDDEEKSKEEVISYITQYLNRAISDYRPKP